MTVPDRNMGGKYAVRLKADACVVDGCGWYGTAYGSPEPLCAARGGPKLCAFEWLEDREAYDDRTTTYREWAATKRGTAAAPGWLLAAIVEATGTHDCPVCNAGRPLPAGVTCPLCAGWTTL